MPVGKPPNAMDMGSPAPRSSGSIFYLAPVEWGYHGGRGLPVRERGGNMVPVLQRIADYISAHRTRASIDALEIHAALLPHFYILEIEPAEARAPPRLRIRLCGTALDRAFGRAVRGHYMDEFLHGARSTEVLHGFQSCAITRKPRWMRQVVTIADRPPRYVEGVAFYVEPDLIYGGLVFGELSRESGGVGFESREL